MRNIEVGAAVEDVVVRSAVQGIEACFAEERVVPLIADQLIFARQAVGSLVGCVAREGVIACRCARAWRPDSHACPSCGWSALAAAAISVAELPGEVQKNPRRQGEFAPGMPQRGRSSFWI